MSAGTASDIVERLPCLSTPPSPTGTAELFSDTTDPAGGDRDLTGLGRLGLHVVDLHLEGGGTDQLVGGGDVGG